MKKLFLLSAFLLCLQGSPLNATPPTESSGSTMEPGKIVVLHPKPAKGRPNSPSKVFIECEYSEGILVFHFPENINSITINLSNGSEKWNGVADVANPIVMIPSFTGLFDIVCVSGDGRILCGTLDFS